MNAISNPMIRIASMAAVLALLGCSEGAAKRGSSPLAPDNRVALGTGAPAQRTGITLPFDPSNFTAPRENPLFPLAPGTAWSYVSQTPDGIETNEVEVTHDTKTILGVRARVVRDRVFLEGSLIEDTFDWYAADNDGNVWYLGEDTKEYDHGVLVSTAGSWEAGKDGAQAGLIMLTDPQVGDTYYQENAAGVVEDQARVKSLDESVSVPYGDFEGCLKTQEWTALEPGNRSFKYYAAGIGLVLEVAPKGGGERVELTALTMPGRTGR